MGNRREASLARRPSIASRRPLLALALSASMLGGVVTARATGRPIRFDHITLDDGLSQSTVLCIHQDRRGFMWFGTEDGLNRYDGHTITQYKNDPTDPRSLPHDYILAIVEDRSGDLWIATDGGGIARWDDTSDSFVAYGTAAVGGVGLVSDLIRDLAIDPQGGIWIATRDAGLNRFDPASGAWRTFRHDPDDPSSLSDDGIYAIWADGDGTIWVGTNAGLDRLDPASSGVTHYRADLADDSSLSDDRIRAVFRDRSGRLWVGTYGGGLNRLDPGSDQFLHYRHDPNRSNSLSHDRVRVIFEDASRRLWVGTVGGLNLLDADGGGFTRYLNDPAMPTTLSSDDVTSIAQDRGGVLWIGTQGGGVNKWNPPTWSFGHHSPSPSDSEDLNHSTVTSFSEDRAGRLWIGTFGGGLNVLDRNSGHMSHPLNGSGNRPGISSNRVMALLHDSRGAAWIGTFGGGLNRYDPGSNAVTVFRQDDANPASIGADGIMTVYEDRQGNIWVGTFGGGLNRFEPGSGAFTRYRHAPADPTTVGSDRVTSIVQAPTGQLWVGTDGAGLNLFDPATEVFRRFAHDPQRPTGLSSNTILALHADQSGRLWIGTRGGGLQVLDRVPGPGQDLQLVSYGERDGLPNDVVYGIEEDDRGILWLSTNYGLSSFDRTIGSFRNYSVGHGLQSNEFNFGAHFKTSDGALAFGGVNGFNLFHPDRLESSTTPPPVVLTSFLKFNQPVLESGPAYRLDKVELAYRDDIVTFEFAALDFSAPHRNVYAYRLEGLGTDWIDLGAVHRVTFTDLDGGEYVLRVRAANSDGVWNDDGINLTLEVAPPPWLTLWAYLGYSTLGAAGLAAFVGVQRQKLRRQEVYSRRLEAEVAQRTGELAAKTEELAERNAELETLNLKLADASLTDSLTGLRNRRYLFEEGIREIALVDRQLRETAAGTTHNLVRHVVFIMLDLDGFKSINDTFGHPAGDQVLIQLRDVLVAACRESDVVVRWGGDEFLVVARDTLGDRSQTLAERIRGDVEKHAFTLGDGHTVRTTASVGYACYPFLRQQPFQIKWQQVLALADAAQYVAKKSSRNASVGFIGTPTSHEVPDLFGAILDHPAALSRRGQLEIRTSIPELQRRFPREPEPPPGASGDPGDGTAQASLGEDVSEPERLGPTDG